MRFHKKADDRKRKPSKPAKSKGTPKKAKPLTPEETVVSNHVAETFVTLRAAVGSKAVQDALEQAHINTSTDVFPWQLFGDKLAKVADPLAEITRRSILQRHLMPKSVALQTRFNFHDPRVISSAKRQASKLAEVMSAEQYAKVRTIIGNGVEKGATVKQISRALRDHIGISARQDRQMLKAVSDATAKAVKAGYVDEALTEQVQNVADNLYDKLIRIRAELIARTETIAAQNNGLWIGVQQSVEDPQSSVDVTWSKRWMTSIDERDCEQCAELDGQEVAIDEDFEYDGDSIPFPDPMFTHPNCFPAGTFVQSRALTGAVKRFYKGELIELATGEGLFLSVTPNHPILTRRGWVGAQFLNKGDEIFTHSFIEGENSLDMNDDDVPALIEEVVEAFSRSHGVVSREVPTSAPDFHSDGTDGEIAVVFANGGLNTNIQPSVNQPSINRPFVARVNRSTQLNLLGFAYQSFMAPLHAANRIMRLFHIRTMLLRSFILSNDGVALFLASQRNLVIEQDSSNRSSGTSKFLTQSEDALLGEVSPDDLGKMSVDFIASTHSVPFSGYVYNLETVNGWYLANGIVTHNCRCTFGLVPPERNIDAILAGTESAVLSENPDMAEAATLDDGWFSSALTPEDNSLAWEAIKGFLKYNENHDELGRFSSGDGGKNFNEEADYETVSGDYSERYGRIIATMELSGITQAEFNAIDHYTTYGYREINTFLRNGEPYKQPKEEWNYNALGADMVVDDPALMQAAHDEYGQMEERSDLQVARIYASEHADELYGKYVSAVEQRVQGEADRISKVIDEAPASFGDVNLYRLIENDVIDSLAVGDIMTDKGFLSTTRVDMVDPTNIKLANAIRMNLSISANHSVAIILPNSDKDGKGLAVDMLRTAIDAPHSVATTEKEVILPTSTPLEVIAKDEENRTITFRRKD